MIRYEITASELKQRIRDARATWFTRAAKALQELPDAPKSAEFKGLWSEIKAVYTKLQHSKCAFCEKPLENAIEQDVEHFRPKAEVVRWTPPQDLIDEGIVVKQRSDGSKELGYRFLAYHPFNYVVSCKNCNTIFKGNFFPIGKSRKSQAKRPPADSTEEPFLIYPLGDADENPEALITFEGISPMALPASGRGRLRALVTIAIFKLGDPIERKTFFQERARAIERLFFALEAIAANVSTGSVHQAQAAVHRCIQPSSPFASCLRCFRRLYEHSQVEARQIYDDIAVFLDSFSPA